jgi:alanine racemase
MPIIKANAYGTYINKRLDVINEFDIVGVAIIDEAIELRELGYEKEIFILNQPCIDDIEDILKYNITIGLSSYEFLNELLKINNKIKVHLEIETGMNRTGIKLKDLEDFINKINENILVEGVYTHLSSADYDIEYTNKQLELFEEAVNKVKNKFNGIKYIHSLASNGLLNYNDNISNLVRAGIVLYGYDSFEGMKNIIDVDPICKLKTKINFIKEINKGESISYSRKFIADKNMKIATIPIGYADGLKRTLSNKGEVVIKGKRVPIIGSICMDSFMVDVTDIEYISIGEDVYIWDNENITVEEIAEICGTINYEIICTVSYRVPRVFVN